MDVPDDSVIDRLTNRRLDPITGERYELRKSPELIDSLSF